MGLFEQSTDDATGMGCVLRVSGDDFDVDDLQSRLRIVPVHVERKGKPRFGHASKIADSTSFNIVTSEVSEHDLSAQIRDTVAYLQRHGEDVQRIMSFPGVTSAVLDFAIERRDVVVQNDYLPPELLLLAGKFGIGINLSQCPPCDSPSTPDHS
jgi:hypothetical protein